ncbi:hypothetical protein J0S82_017872 [Galemys pyrenaicus]|uniref:Small ribosomal subunit protein eS24 n=1 Tax=Galemys pyrenaicus TaxID=202257 RepID=A0A8J6A0H0_GALPY|nr:hypothetical protein J0S82_017872 [Galemys pyrenaicus]
MSLSLPGCLKIHRHHERQSNHLHQEVHGQSIALVEINGHRCPSPWDGNSSFDRNLGKLVKMYKTSLDAVSVFGPRAHFGGGKTTGFDLIHDSVHDAKKMTPNTDLQDLACARRRDSRKQSKAKTEWRQMGAAKASVGAGKRRRKDSAVTLSVSVLIVQILRED